MFGHGRPYLWMAVVVCTVGIMWFGGWLLGSHPLGSSETLAVSLRARRHDFGQVAAGIKLIHRFQFTNEGHEQLQITDIRTTCGCLTYLKGTDRLLPGQSGFIEVELRTLGLHPPARLEKTVWLNFRAKTQKLPVGLTVCADVRPDVSIFPKEIFFKGRSSHESYRSTIEIHRELLSVSEFATVEVVPSADYYAVEEDARDDNKLRVVVSLETAAAPTYPRSIEVRYTTGGESKMIYLPTMNVGKTESVGIVPSCYLARVNDLRQAEESRRATTRRMRLRTDDQREVTITNIRPRSADHVFGWAVPSAGASEFLMWVKRLPKDNVMSSTALVVSYFDRQRNHHGEVTLNAYLIRSRSEEDANRVIGNKGQQARVIMKKPNRRTDISAHQVSRI